MTIDNKILDKIGKIKAMSESAAAIGNEAEAQAFATMMQNLLAKHKLEMTDIEYTAHVKEEPIEEWDMGGSDRVNGKRVYQQYPDVEISGSRCEWSENLMRTICEAHGCSFLVCSGTSRLWIVGQKSNSQIVEYIYITLYRSLITMAHREYKKARYEARRKDNGGGRFLHETHGFKDSYMWGFISRLRQRFEEEKRKMESGNSGTALMRINKEALAVRKYLDEKKGKSAKALGGRNSFNSDGYGRGKAAADGVRLDANAVNGGSESQKQLR